MRNIFLKIVKVLNAKMKAMPAVIVVVVLLLFNVHGKQLYMVMSG